MRGSLIAKRGCLLLLLVIFGFYFYGLGQLPLVGPDEPRYAQVAREMFLRGDLITPTLAGHTWFEKPVLLYWLMEGSFLLFGISEAAARFGPALCGVLTVIAVYWVGQQIERTTTETRYLACSSALLLATMFGTIVFSRGASFDIVVTMTLTWCLCFFLTSLIAESTQQRRSRLIGFYVFMGASLLAKGLVGLVIPFGIVIFFQLIRRTIPDRFFRLSLVWGLPLAIATSAIWYGPVIAKHGWQFVDEFFVQHHFARYISPKYHHPQPFYFYVPIVFALALPWLPLTISALVDLRKLNSRGSAIIDRVLVFLVAWLLAPLLFFSLSQSKLPGYVLPVLPALALLGGHQVTKFINNPNQSPLILRLTGLWFALLGVGLFVYGKTTGEIGNIELLYLAAPAFAAGLLAMTTQKRRLAVLTIILAIPISFALALNLAAPSFAATHSTRELFGRANGRGYGSASVYQLHEIDRSSEFYAAGRLAYEATGEPLKFEGAFQVLSEARRKREAVLVLVPLRHVEQVTSLEGATVELIGNNNELALVAVRAND